MISDVSYLCQENHVVVIGIVIDRQSMLVENVLRGELVKHAVLYFEQSDLVQPGERMVIALNFVGDNLVVADALRSREPK